MQNFDDFLKFSSGKGSENILVGYIFILINIFNLLQKSRFLDGISFWKRPLCWDFLLKEFPFSLNNSQMSKK